MKRAFLVAGLAYGDEGKGATVDFLCREYQAGLVVRYNGGAQAAHNVVTPDGRHHTFSQFGSGTFIPGVKTYLSRFMLVNPNNMIEEEQALQRVGVTDAFSRMTVDGEALVVTPFHVALHRLELDAAGGHNSCGQGICVARRQQIKYGNAASLTAKDIAYGFAEPQLRYIQKICRFEATGLESSKRHDLLDALYDEHAVGWVLRKYDYWREKVKVTRQWALAVDLATMDVVVFEGAQGVLLDETHGEEGYNTWTDCTFANAETLLRESRYTGEAQKIGVLRTYFTRHGDGPFPTELTALADVVKERLPENDNSDLGYQGRFRVGSFDFCLVNKAIKICGGVHGIALNHLDLNEFDRNGYDALHRAVQAPVLITGRGPSAAQREFVKEKTAAL